MKYFRGRMNRTVYWLSLVVVLGLLAALRLMGHSATVNEVILIFLSVPRLHDIGRSGWWVLCPVAIEIVGLVIGFALFPPDSATVPVGVAVVIIAGLMIWLGALPGDSAENRFGPPPLPWLGKKRRSKASDADEGGVAI